MSCYKKKLKQILYKFLAIFFYISILKKILLKINEQKINDKFNNFKDLLTFTYNLQKI